jgi:hypothetical protein
MLGLALLSEPVDREREIKQRHQILIMTVLTISRQSYIQMRARRESIGVAS